MSILDDLKREYRTGGITQKLIFWNIGLFIFPLIIISILKLSGVDARAFDWTERGVNDWFSVSSNPADLLWKPWSIIGYAFLHHDFFHIFFNMLMLYFSGRLFTTFFTQKQLFGVYILSAIFGGLLFIAGYNLIPLLAGGSAKMTGASAAVMAILVATAVYAPYMQVRLLLIGTVKLWHVAAAFIALDLILASASNSGGHIAHLGGALFGFLYIKLLQKGTDLTKGVSAVTEGVENMFKPKKKSPFKKVHRTEAQPQRPSSFSGNKDITQKRIDEILDKISKSGYDSLTKEEKDFLFKVGK